MDNDENRAKQFLPFDALEGLKEALHEKEIEYEERLELSQEQSEKISNNILSLNINDIVEITYYDNRKYIKVKGKVKNIDYIGKRLKIDEIKINFEDIIKIEK